jgi:hypothetical protein
MTGKPPVKLDWRSMHFFVGAMRQTAQSRSIAFERAASRCSHDGRVFFYVQHLWASAICAAPAILARSLAASGFDVLWSRAVHRPNGLALDGVALPPAAAAAAPNAGLRELSALTARRSTMPSGLDRTRRLVDLFPSEAPDVLMTEHFRSGRTQLRFRAAAAPRGGAGISLVRGSCPRCATRAALGLAALSEEMEATFEAFDHTTDPCRSPSSYVTRRAFLPGTR